LLLEKKLGTKPQNVIRGRSLNQGTEKLLEAGAKKYPD
jgi:hypothetical protein